MKDRRRIKAIYEDLRHNEKYMCTVFDAYGDAFGEDGFVYTNVLFEDDNCPIPISARYLRYPTLWEKIKHFLGVEI